MIEHGAHYIGGQSQASNGSDTIAVVNAATKEVMGSIPAGNAQDADEAVRAAREAFGSWSTKSPAERAGYLKRTAPTGPEPLPGRTDHRQSAIRCRGADGPGPSQLFAPRYSGVTSIEAAGNGVKRLLCARICPQQTAPVRRVWAGRC